MPHIFPPYLIKTNYCLDNDKIILVVEDYSVRRRLFFGELEIEGRKLYK